jgi:hypothetical protein
VLDGKKETNIKEFLPWCFCDVVIRDQLMRVVLSFFIKKQQHLNKRVISGDFVLQN